MPSGVHRHDLRGLPWWPQAHSCVALLPYTKVVRKARKTASLPEPKTLGEHIKRVRLARGLYQKDVAKAVAVTTDTVHNWEAGKTEPPIGIMPAVLAFLGYDPS